MNKTAKNLRDVEGKVKRVNGMLNVPEPKRLIFIICEEGVDVDV